jgi:hypothetical protein
VAHFGIAMRFVRLLLKDVPTKYFIYEKYLAHISRRWTSIEWSDSIKKVFCGKLCLDGIQRL